MPANKNQHFVSQFYLRRFALAKSDRLISLLHIPSDRYVPEAPIRSQACGDDFYKSSNLEAGLKDLEGHAARIFSAMTERREFPTRLSEDHHLLLLFAICQATRTPEAAAELEEQTNRLLKEMAAHDPRRPKPVEESEPSVKVPVTEALRLAVLCHEIAIDLRFKLLVNVTKVPFITSDHPAVLYNQFLEARKFPGGHAGFAVRGLQLFFPLDSLHLLVLFDADVYKVGGRKVTQMTVEVDRLADVDALNVLQAANSSQHLYFDEGTPAAYVRRIAHIGVKARRTQRGRVITFVPADPRPGRVERLFLFHRVDLETRLKLSCCRIIPSMLEKPLSSRAVQRRNPELADLHQEFIAEVDAGRWPLGDFVRYVLSRKKKELLR